MLIVKTIQEYRQYIDNKKDKSIGFIPTMGALHFGHLSLVEKSKKENDITVVSIFVNPTQFGSDEDFYNYPREIEEDIEYLVNKDVDVLFNPDISQIYDDQEMIKIFIEDKYTKILCGNHRAGHFDGVLRVVLKLFNIIHPNKSYFGLKDYQQYYLVKKITNELRMPIEIVGCPTMREKSGLAISSRNTYLKETDIQDAKAIYLALNMLAKRIKLTGKCDQDCVLKIFTQFIWQINPNFQVQYLEIYDLNLQPTSVYRKDNTFIGVAVFFCGVRLIDNIIF